MSYRQLLYQKHFNLINNSHCSQFSPLVLVPEGWLLSKDSVFIAVSSFPFSLPPALLVPSPKQPAEPTTSCASKVVDNWCRKSLSLINWFCTAVLFKNIKFRRTTKLKHSTLQVCNCPIRMRCNRAIPTVTHPKSFQYFYYLLYRKLTHFLLYILNNFLKDHLYLYIDKTCILISPWQDTQWQWKVNPTSINNHTYNESKCWAYD